MADDNPILTGPAREAVIADIRACAALERDLGAKGYNQGMAARLAGNRAEPIRESYAAGIREYLRELRGGR